MLWAGLLARQKMSKELVCIRLPLAPSTNQGPGDMRHALKPQFSPSDAQRESPASL